MLAPEEFACLEEKITGGEAVSATEAVQVGGYPMVTAYAGGKQQRESTAVVPAVAAFDAQVAHGVLEIDEGGAVVSPHPVLIFCIGNP